MPFWKPHEKQIKLTVFKHQMRLKIIPFISIPFSSMLPISRLLTKLIRLWREQFATTRKRKHSKIVCRTFVNNVPESLSGWLKAIFNCRKVISYKMLKCTALLTADIRVWYCILKYRCKEWKAGCLLYHM